MEEKKIILFFILYLVVKSGNPPLISSYTPYTIKSNQNLDTHNYKSGKTLSFTQINKNVNIN